MMIIPTIIIINFEESAHIFTKAFPFKKPLNKSNPPRNIIIPMKKVIFINLFLFSVFLFPKYEIIKIGNPKNDGIKEVSDSLSLRIVTLIPHIIKNKPINNKILSIFFTE